MKHDSNGRIRSHRTRYYKSLLSHNTRLAFAALLSRYRLLQIPFPNIVVTRDNTKLSVKTRKT